MENADCSTIHSPERMTMFCELDTKSRAPFTRRRTVLEELVKTKKSSVRIAARYANLLVRIILE
jgi:hypothetical protein